MRAMKIRAATFILLAWCAATLLTVYQVGAGESEETPTKVLVTKGAYAPGLCVSPSGEVCLVYKGSDQPTETPRSANSLYFRMAVSIDASLGQPVKIGDFQTLISGMRRGPRVAASGKTILVTGVEREKFIIQSFRSEDGGQTWAGPVQVNSPQSRNGEGLYDMTVSPTGMFHVVWLDERVPKEAHI